MSALSVIEQINHQTLTLGPAAIVAVQAAQAAAAGSNATGAEKQSKVVSILTGIEVGTGALESHPDPRVAATALMVNMIVSLFKAFSHPLFVKPA